MIVVERQIQKIYPGKWPELEEIDKKFTKKEKELGFPPKKRYVSIASAYDSNTIIIEREWESFAMAEATYEKANADPEYQNLIAGTGAIVKSVRREFYMPQP